ncbi:MAG: TonB-dependent receptor [Sulfuricurvum sp.]|uniref:TonB-dependent receptor plug domain-containing protein n=1 Tax=Sulfuricurvum sp. TaxID=2025608 RepID=UPI002634BE21|nr:TonB-dependent receptor [Sulfuricurvum sp.]MDD2830031.1 TonB-dependent receptor [Sulfuricurvum sp.]MDD4948352.1 TonB-dependent receptor [Sulfuricurvum sp.]
MSQSRLRSLFLISLALTTFLSADDTPKDVTTIPLEELLQTEYIPASHIANQISNAASAVSIVTAQDIKDYGYQTLGDILGSMRGLHTFQDYSYTFLAGRGYSTPKEYAGRIAVLIDGYRADDSMFGQAYLGNDGILDVSMIERVEYIPGGSSAGYSNGALLGVINIITKKGSDIDGTQVALGFGRYETLSRRATFGKRFENGVDIVTSFSDYDSNGQSYTYNINGIDTLQSNQHGENSKKLFVKGSYEYFSLVAAYSKRNVDIPSYPYAGEWNDQAIHNHDENRFIRLAADFDITNYLKFSSSVWYGSYQYALEDSVSMSSMDSLMEFKDDAKWYGGDVKLVGTWFDDHVISIGTEYRHDYRWDNSHVFTDVVANDVWWSYHGSYPARKTYSVYGYDEWRWSQVWELNYGARYEKSDNGYHAFTPQAALIWKPRLSTEVKLSTGITHRQATPSEDTTLTPERVHTNELVIEERLDHQNKILTSFYQYRLRDQISKKDNNGIDARGVEVEFEKYWDNRTRLRTSYAYQNVSESDTGLALVNAPHHIAKLNFSVPFVDEKLRMGLDIQYLGTRPLYTDARQEYAPSHTLTNLTLLSHEWVPKSDLSLKVSNLFNKTYGDVVDPQSNGDLLYPQNGRAFWIQWEYNFR